jgi:hypothetical protein
MPTSKFTPEQMVHNLRQGTVKRRWERWLKALVEGTK